MLVTATAAAQSGQEHYDIRCSSSNSSSYVTCICVLCFTADAFSVSSEASAVQHNQQYTSLKLPKVAHSAHAMLISAHSLLALLVVAYKRFSRMSSTSQYDSAKPV